ncbi:hypothetical protein ACJJTC_005682 [Scirpophaga incertulas]
MVITKDVKFLKNNYYETTTTNILGNINTSEPLTQSDVIKIDFENNEEIINENETLYEVPQVDQIDSTSPEIENVDNSQQDEPNIEEPVVVSTSNQRYLRDRSIIHRHNGTMTSYWQQLMKSIDMENLLHTKKL